jgi:hypothetical protein
MTNKEYIKVKLTTVAILILLIGMSAGAVIASLRMDAEIRTDQLELKEQVAEIIEDKAIIRGIVETLLFQVEQLKLERQELRELKILLSKGE